MGSVFALLSFYVSCNYYVVREISISMFNLTFKDTESLSFGWLFWLFTSVIPFVYIVRGIQKKDAVLIRVGLLLVAVLVITVRYYYNLMPAEIVMVAAGLLLIGIASAIIKYLSEPKNGFTSAAITEKHLIDSMHIEALVIAETFNGVQLPGPGTSFGGGDFGGGGSSSDF